MEMKPKNLWKHVYASGYQHHATIPTIYSTNEDEDESVVYIKDLKKRKEVYGICGECNKPGTGENWCRPCNAERFKRNFKNWTSGNINIDEFIQYAQLNAIHYYRCLEWIPFEKFQNITYIAEGGFGKIYSAKWPEGHIEYWDIENQKWYRYKNYEYVLKSLNNSSNISSDFLNEIKSHLQIYLYDVVTCFGITQNPNTKEYMMVLRYCENGNLRNYLNKSEYYIGYGLKIDKLQQIARGLLDIHNAGFVHKDFHSGNIVHNTYDPFISDLGMCQPVSKQTTEIEGVYGVLPYMAPEVLRRHRYTKAADIYSFGIVMNEFLSEEIPFNDIPHDEFLAVKICKGHRPKISKVVPKLLTDLVIKCLDAEIKNRPTAKEVYQTLTKWNDEKYDKTSELHSQIKECDKIREKKFNRSSEDKSINTQSHPQAIYTSRLLQFKNLPKPVNSSVLFNSDINYTNQLTSANTLSECLDVQLSELELNEINENDIE